MGFLSFFENKMEDTLEGVADKMFDSPISPVQIAKKAEKQMRREKTVGAGKQYAPTLYTVLVNPQDDVRLMGYYPTLAGETETYLQAKAAEQGLVMDGQPLVRFFVDEGLKKGKFDIVAESVAAPIVTRLRHEEMQRYNSAAQQLSKAPSQRQGMQSQAQAFEFADLPEEQTYDEPVEEAATPSGKPPLPYVPEDELDYSIDYGEYTFDSHDFEDYRDQGGDFEAPSAAEDREGKRLNRPARQPHEIAAQQASSEAADAAAVEAAAAGAAARAAAAAAAAGAEANAANAGRAARTARPARKQQVTGPCLFDRTNNRTHKLTKNLLAVGREASCDIVIPDINASREHAQLRYQTPGVWWIVDSRSTNGTLVNGVETSRSELHDGDIITIGMSELVFQEH